MLLKDMVTIRRLLSLGLYLILLTSCKDNSPKNTFTTPIAKNELQFTISSPLSKDTVLYINRFKSNHVESRTIEIWLPAGYPKKNTAYKVLYMHDGQNVFSKESANYGKSWDMATKMDSLTAAGAIKPTIVVASWSHKEFRFNEYMPQQPRDLTSSAFAKAKLKKLTGHDKLLSDNYLRFMTSELKPYIDAQFKTSVNKEDTIIMGSSMGGLISLYGVLNYPEIYGTAVCMSTHWTVPELGDAFIESLPATIPAVGGHRFYFDYGTETLDAAYEPLQKQVDAIFKNKGYQQNSYVSLKFLGHQHDEIYWNKRVATPLIFALN